MIVMRSALALVMVIFLAISQGILNPGLHQSVCLVEITASASCADPACPDSPDSAAPEKQLPDTSSGPASGHAHISHHHCTATVLLIPTPCEPVAGRAQTVQQPVLAESSPVLPDECTGIFQPPKIA
jgi:hypothetical protein